MTDTRSRLKKAIVVLLIPGVMILAFGLSPGLAQAQNYVNDPSVCLDCHDDMGAAFERNVHSRLEAYQYPGAGADCEACHGPGAAHADSGEPADILNPVAELGGDAAEVCIACHRTGANMLWDMSAHAASDLACQSCHQLHGHEAKTALLVDTESELCFGCHADTREKFQLPSHHPIREGFMTCHDCHDPHSGKWTGVEWEEMSNELCFRCHGDKVGPFVFEHSPVEEDCAICHEVHGTVASYLLRQNEPFLCMQCHQPHFHTGLRTIDGSYSATDAVIEDDPSYGGLSGMSTADGFKRAMMTKCTQCHQEIHGTDLPSQSITGQGRALNR